MSAAWNNDETGAALTMASSIRGLINIRITAVADTCR